MGFYSRVQTVAETKAYELFKAVVEKYREKDGLKPDYQEHETYGIITFDWIRWYNEYDVVAETNALIKNLQTQHADEEGYGFKQIILNEDDSTEVYTNMRGENIYVDFEILVYVENPFDVPTNLTDWDKYLRYLNTWVQDHMDESCKGMSPACFDEWDMTENDNDE